MGAMERRKKRKEILAQNKTYKVDEKTVQEILSGEVDYELITRLEKNSKNQYDFTADISVSYEESLEFLRRFKKEFNDERFKQLITDCKKEVVTSIVTPFGLGKIVAAYDKVGGNVDTVHNARNGVYATKEEKNKYENKEEYNPDKYHSDTSYIERNKKISSEKKNGGVEDYMTGERIKAHDKYDLDHVVSAKEINDDPGRILAELDGVELANTETNLKATDPTINRSKKDKNMKDFINKKNEKISRRKKELEAKQNLTEKEQKELEKLKKLEKIDDEKAKKADETARKEIDKKINKEYYMSKKFVKNVTVTSITEGAKMGLQQALGVVMVELFTALFDEIIDIYKNGFNHNFEDKKIIEILKERFKRVVSKIKEKWKDVLIAFKDGALSGFLSNLTTTVINMFVTTAKRVVRIIREGFFSLMKAIKLILFPPSGMTFEEAMHEAKKLIASGLIVSLGVIVEEYIDTLIKGSAILEPFSDILTTIFVGAITGIAVTLTVYYIDKKKNDKEFIESLFKQTDEKLNNAEKLLKQLEPVKVNT